MGGACRIIAIANQKGGVGKTTTAFALGAALAERGRRTLLVDLDPQAALTEIAGIDQAALPGTVYTAMCEVVAGREVHTGDYIVAVEDRLDLLGSSIELAEAEPELLGRLRREYVLSEVLLPLRDRYDWILIDCQPSLTLLPINALTCATGCLIPVTPEHLAARGLASLLRMITAVQRHKLNPHLVVEGILLTNYDPRPQYTREMAQQICAFAQARGIPILGEIKRSVRVGEASQAGVALTRYRPAREVADAYREVAKQLDGRCPAEARGRSTAPP